MKDEAIKLAWDTIHQADELATSEGLTDASLLPYLKSRVGMREGTSRGGMKHGRPWISLALGGHVAMTERRRSALNSWLEGKPQPRIKHWRRAALWKAFGWPFSEYAGFENDPEIGQFFSEDWQHHIKALVLHEWAHVVQFNGTKPAGQAHGHTFRLVYRTLRQELLNPWLPQQPTDQEKRRALIHQERTQAAEWSYWMKRALRLETGADRTAAENAYREEYRKASNRPGRKSVW